MRISFDSNAWEKIFDPRDASCASIREALRSGRIKGFICATSFRIEAVRRRDRVRYFANPHITAQNNLVIRDGQPWLRMSVMPDSRRHPGLPLVQLDKLEQALSVGVRLMYGCNWMGLPEPREFLDRTIFVQETLEERHDREQRMYDVIARIEARGVGKTAFDAAGGWGMPPKESLNAKKLASACAEWADGELAASHIAYRNDILCTNDRAGNAGTSIFDAQNRTWLTNEFDVSFKTVDELLAIATDS